MIRHSEHRTKYLSKILGGMQMSELNMNQLRATHNSLGYKWAELADAWSDVFFQVKRLPWMLFVKYIALIIAIMLFCLLISVKGWAQEVDPRVIDTIVYEASSQDLDGQVAVASVIKTRMKERRRSALNVVLRPKQFSCWRNGRPTQSRLITEKERRTAMKAWRLAESGQYNHYARHDCKVYWIKSAKIKERIGSHIFYRL